MSTSMPSSFSTSSPVPIPSNSPSTRIGLRNSGSMGGYVGGEAWGWGGWIIIALLFVTKLSIVFINKRFTTVLWLIITDWPFPNYIPS